MSTQHGGKLAGLAILLLIPGAILLHYGRPLVVRGLATRSWVATDGTIVRAGTGFEWDWSGDEGAERSWIDLLYAYSVLGPDGVPVTSCPAATTPPPATARVSWQAGGG